jgi:hypothetical protein
MPDVAAWSIRRGWSDGGRSVRLTGPGGAIQAELGVRAWELRQRRGSTRLADAPPLHDRPRARPLELHRELQRSLFCRSTTVNEDQRPSVPDIEEEASRFAAALLMPQWLMLRAYGRHGNDLDAMCEAFRASGVAMQRRMDDLFRDPGENDGQGHAD